MPEELADRPWGSLPQRDPALGAEGVTSERWHFPCRGRSLNWTSRERALLPRVLAAFLRVVPCVPWATTVAPARSV
jgi:hypothetical protein